MNCNQANLGQLGRRSNGLRNGVRDVTELQVEENSRHKGRKLLDACRPGRGKQLIPDLDQAKSSLQFPNNADGLWQAAKV